MRAKPSRWASARAPVTVTPIQLARMIGGIASDGHFVRPHVVDPSNKLPAEFRQALKDSFPGSGDSHHSPRSGELDDHHRRHGRGHRSGHGRHGRGLPSGGRRLCRQDRHRPGRQPRGHQAPGRRQRNSCPTAGLSASFPAETRSSSSPSSGSTATGAQTRPGSPPRWPPSTSTSSACRTRTSWRRPATPQAGRDGRGLVRAGAAGHEVAAMPSARLAVCSTRTAAISSSIHFGLPLRCTGVPAGRSRTV